MDKVFEIIMIVLFDIAMLSEVFRLARNINDGNIQTQVAHIGFAVGFFLGMIAKYLLGGEYTTMILYALGFMLSYTAFIFGFTKKEEI